MMLQTDTTKNRPASRLEGFSALSSPTRERDLARPEQRNELAIDDTLAASFPASDPPGWNPGRAGTGSIVTVREPATHDRPTATRPENGAGQWDVIEVSRLYDSERTIFQTLTSMVGAIAAGMVVPIAILLVGLPVALGVRAMLEVLQWLMPAIR